MQVAEERVSIKRKALELLLKDECNRSVNPAETNDHIEQLDSRLLEL